MSRPQALWGLPALAAAAASRRPSPSWGGAAETPPDLQGEAVSWAELRRAGPGARPVASCGPTQELLGGPGELRAAAQPVAQPLQVEPCHPLAVDVGQRVEAAELLQVLPVPGAPAVRRHDAEERPVGAAPEGEADDDVPAAVTPQEAAACKRGERRAAGPGRAAEPRPRALTELHHGGDRALPAARRDDVRGAGSAVGRGTRWGPGDTVAPPQVVGQLIGLFGKDDGDFETNAPIDCTFQVPPRGTQASGRGTGKPMWGNQSSGVRQGGAKGRGGGTGGTFRRRSGRRRPEPRQLQQVGTGGAGQTMRAGKSPALCGVRRGSGSLGRGAGGLVGFAGRARREGERGHGLGRSAGAGVRGGRGVGSSAAWLSPNPASGGPWGLGLILWGVFRHF